MGWLEDITGIMTLRRAGGWLSIAIVTDRDFTQVKITTLNVVCPGLKVLMSNRQHWMVIMAIPDVKFNCIWNRHSSEICFLP